MTGTDRRASPTLGQRLLAGTAWKLAGHLAWRLSGAVTGLLVARILGPVLLGELGAVHSTVSLFAVYAGFRLGATATKYVAEFRDRSPRRAARVLHLALGLGALTSLVAAAALFVLAPAIAARVFEQPGLATAFRIGALLLLLTVLGNVWVHALTGLERFRSLAGADLARALVLPLLCLPLVLTLRVEGMLAGLAGVALVHLVIVSRLTKRAAREAELPERLERGEPWRERDVLWRFALPGLLSGILITSAFWWGRVLLTRRENGFEDLGLFTAADQWRTLILFVPSIVGTVLLPVISRAQGLADGRVGEASGLGLRAICTIALPVAVALTALAGWVELLYGARFEGLAEVVSVLAAAGFAAAVGEALRRVFDGLGHRWASFALQTAWAALFLGSFVVLIPRFGAMGFAVAHLVAALLLVILQGIYVERRLAPRTVRDQSGLLIASALLLIAAHVAFRFADPGWLAGLGVGLTALAIVPAWRERRSLIEAGRGLRR